MVVYCGPGKPTLIKLETVPETFYSTKYVFLGRLEPYELSMGKSLASLVEDLRDRLCVKIRQYYGNFVVP
jgi:hypothetical protein